MNRLVLDTNTLIQCVSRRSRYHELWLSLLDGRNQLCVTTEILAEYAEILERKTTNTFAALVLDVITNSPYTLFITPYFKFNVITADPDDNKFVDCAIQANARYIVTNDHHYDVLRRIKFPVVDIMALQDFLALLHSER